MTANCSREKIEYSVKEVKQLVGHVLERSHAVSELREIAVGQLTVLHQQQAQARGKFSVKMQSLAMFIDKQNRVFEESMAATASIATHTTEDEPMTRGLMTNK